MNNLCKCGCGKEVRLPSHVFLKGHVNKGKKFIVDDKTRHNMSISHLGKKHTIQTKNKISINNGRYNLGKSISEETKKKMGVSHIGQKRSEETKHKMSINNGMKGKKHTIETKIKMSISTSKYLHNNSYGPRRGKNENQIIDQLQKETKLSLLRNDFVIANKCGKYPDGYSPKYNLSIDILESHHFKSNGELSDYDQERELIMSSVLGCMIYYIPEQEFLTNTEQEIQRFKNFLSLLEYGVN